MLGSEYGASGGTCCLGEEVPLQFSSSTRVVYFTVSEYSTTLADRRYNVVSFFMCWRIPLHQFSRSILSPLYLNSTVVSSGYVVTLALPSRVPLRSNGSSGPVDGNVR